MAFEYVTVVPEPVMTAAELSVAVGRLTKTCEALRADIVALEKRLSGEKPALKQRVKRWLAAKLAE